MKEQRKPLSPKEIEIVKAKLEGKRQVAIGRTAFPDATPDSASVLVSRVLKKPNVQEALQEALVKKGLDIDSIAEIVVAGTRANRVAMVEGDFYETGVPDHSIRLKAVGMAAQFMGINKGDGVTNNFLLMADTQKEKYDIR